MRYYNVFDLKIQELYVFISVAEYQSITKAAEFLYLTPSQVSKIIKKLEYQWGVQLFIRDKKTICLTPAGRHAYQGLNHVVRNIERVLEETVHVQEVKPFIRIGCPTLSMPNELFVPAIEAFHKISPDASVTIECKDTLADLRKLLIGEEVDLIYTADVELFEDMDIVEWREMERLPMYIIMNKEHHLSGRENLHIKDLEYEEFVLTTPTSEMYVDYAVRLCRQYGFTPRVARYVPNIYSQLMEIHINPEVVCIQTCKGFRNDESLYYQELPDIYWKMGFAYRKDAPEVIKEFVKCAVQCMENPSSAATDEGKGLYYN